MTGKKLAEKPHKYGLALSKSGQYAYYFGGAFDAQTLNPVFIPPEGFVLDRNIWEKKIIDAIEVTDNLLNVAEAVGGWKFDVTGEISPLFPDVFLDFRDKMAHPTQNDQTSRFIGWLLTSKKTRGVYSY